MNLSLTTHMSAARAISTRPGCAQLSGPHFGLPRPPLSLSSCICLSLPLSLSLCVSWFLGLSGSPHHSLSQEAFPALPRARRLPPHPSAPPSPTPSGTTPAVGTWENSQPLWPLSVLWAVPSPRHCGWENQASTIKSCSRPAPLGPVAQLPPGAGRPGGLQLSLLGAERMA